MGRKEVQQAQFVVFATSLLVALRGILPQSFYLPKVAKNYAQDDSTHQQSKARVNLNSAMIFGECNSRVYCTCVVLTILNIEYHNYEFKKKCKQEP